MFITGILVVLVTRVVLKIMIQAVIEIALKLTDIKYYSKSKTSVYYTGFSKNYRLPPVWQNKVSQIECFLVKVNNLAVNHICFNA